VVEEKLTRKLTTILAADVAGYSRLMADDEAGTYAQLKAHRKELIEPKSPRPPSITVASSNSRVTARSWSSAVSWMP
jgi:hypothetical protein